MINLKKNFFPFHRPHFALGVAVIVAAPILLSFIHPLAQPVAAVATRRLSKFYRVLSAPRAQQRIDPAWLKQRALQDIIAKHESYRAEFRRWRRLFARHAEELAALLKTFPGAENLQEIEVRQTLAQMQQELPAGKESEVFGPWTNHWMGMWSNGMTQYHIWDSTRLVDGRWLQPVTLSEFEFIAPDRLDAMVAQRRADAALNVYSRESGVTGWVSKYQHGRFEIPHIGYALNDSSLIWICQVKTPAHLFAPESCWFVFFETVSTASSPAEYNIYGRSILINNDSCTSAGLHERHNGTYFAASR